mmetsp:Transcript_14043/g.33968  ORF Transcript_14043/g.33968 Transcript_14043/m.33968 type:complete len:1243 (-) Transcript_14043:96-3824(-)
MKVQPKLLRLLTPPPLTHGDVLLGQDLQSITHSAMSIHLTKSVPTSTPRTSTHKQQITTMHPSQPLLAYLLVPAEERDKKILSKSIVVQNSKTRAVVASVTLSELVSSLYNIDTMSDKATEKQHRVLRDLGHVQRLEFFDPSTLYWSGHGTVKRHQELEQRWSYLFVQFQSSIVILNLRRHSVSITNNVKVEQEFRPIVAHVTQKLLGGEISSNVVPLSRQTFMVATGDGYIKTYNWKTSTVVDAIKVVANKNDSVVHLCSTNKYNSTEQYYAASARRIVCLCKKGAGFMMELQISDGAVTSVSQPLYKFEGGTVPTAISIRDDTHSSMEHVLLHYCGYRDLLLWTLQAKSKGKLLVWDMSNLPYVDRRGKKPEPIKVDPTLVTQFPYENISHTLFHGWFNEALSTDCIASAAITKEGNFQILLSPIHGGATSVKSPFLATTVFSVDVGQILQRDLQLPDNKEVQLKVHSIYCPSLRDCSLFCIGTNVGSLMIKMMDGNLIPFPGGRHAHLSANYGSLGKAVLTIRRGEIVYGSLESSDGLGHNPLGPMESKNQIIVYDAPPPLHLPPEIHKRPVRLPPLFLPSPSRKYLCCFWKEEMRYEILHFPTILDRISSGGKAAFSPLVASGNGVSSFAWIGNDDLFGLLYNPEQDLALKVGIDLSAPQATLGRELANAAQKITDVTKLKELKNLKEIMSLNTGAGKSHGRMHALKGIQELGTGTGKAAMKFTKGSVNLTKKVAKGTTKIAVGAAVGVTGKARLAVVTGKARTSTVGAANIASFGLLGRKKKEREKAENASLATVDMDDMDDISRVSERGEQGDENLNPSERKFPWVELRSMDENIGADGLTSARSSNIGQLMLRTGNRNPPTILFGGPVLCVGNKYNEHDEGIAYFYTKKKGEKGDKASHFVSSGPAFPCPDIVVWDDEGQLCAVIIRSRISVYLSDEPNFVMLGTVRTGSTSDADDQIISARFIHGVLYCSTRSSVQCVFLGDLEGGVCNLDIFTLANSDIITLPPKTIATDGTALSPSVLPMALNYPTILGYQNGSLMVSTAAGVHAIPLDSPILRIGALIAAGQQHRAEPWFDAIPEDDHEALAAFLERRGTPALALQLSGVSLETIVDICMRNGFVEQLEQVVEEYGLKGLHSIDMGRGVSSNVFGPEDHGTSIVVCVGAYLLSYGRVELVRRLATECLSSVDDGKREGFLLASLLLSVQGSDSRRVIERSVKDIGEEEDWPVGEYVRDHIL